MSWDISIMKLSRPYRSFGEIPHDEKLAALGSRPLVQRLISAVFAGTDWTNPNWGNWSGDIGSVEFNLGESEPVEMVILHVRAGEEVVPMVVELCLANGWQGFDYGTGTSIELSDTPERGLQSWSTFRNKVIGGLGGDAQDVVTPVKPRRTGQ